MEKPKRPLSAYMIWLNSERESIKKENPGIKVTEIAKRGGELWRAMKDKSVSTKFPVYPFLPLSLLIILWSGSSSGCPPFIITTNNNTQRTPIL